jgi:streptogramin lyase
MAQFLFSLLVISLFVIDTFGQTYEWVSFTKDNSQLKSNNLNALQIDHDGILWIGSDSGLTGYNGSAWISYNAGANNLASNEVSSIRIDAGSIWIGTDSGLSSGQINSINDIALEEPFRIENSSLINNHINSINIDSLGSCWICTDSGITVITDTSWEAVSTSSEFYLSKNKVLAINQQPTQMQYVGTENGGVCRLYNSVDGVTGASTIWKQWTAFPDSTGRIQAGLLSDTVQAILVAKNGDRWYGTEHGVSSHTGQFLKNPYSWRSYTTEIGLINNNIQALAEDSTGAIWIGTSDGVSKLLPADTTWTNFTVHSGLISNDVRDIAIEKDGSVWFATSGGLSKLNIIASAISHNDDKIPRSFDVYPAFPNPFNMSTSIKFKLAGSTRIKISVYDINGRLVNSILNSHLIPGNYTVNWNGKNISYNDAASGVYFAVIQSSDQISSLKLVLVK